MFGTVVGVVYMNFSFPVVITSSLSSLTSLTSALLSYKISSFYAQDLDLISVYAGGGSDGIPEDIPCGLDRFEAPWLCSWLWCVSRLLSFRFKNSCLLCHSC
jgi:hypothetical protein